MILTDFIICIFLHFMTNWLIYYKVGKIMIFQAEQKQMYKVTNELHPKVRQSCVSSSIMSICPLIL